MRYPSAVVWLLVVVILFSSRVFASGYTLIVYQGELHSRQLIFKSDAPPITHTSTVYSSPGILPAKAIDTTRHPIVSATVHPWFDTGYTGHAESPGSIEHIDSAVELFEAGFNKLLDTLSHLGIRPGEIDQIAFFMAGLDQATQSETTHIQQQFWNRVDEIFVRLGITLPKSRLLFSDTRLLIEAVRENPENKKGEQLDGVDLLIASSCMQGIKIRKGQALDYPLTSEIRDKGGFLQLGEYFCKKYIRATPTSEAEAIEVEKVRKVIAAFIDTEYAMKNASKVTLEQWHEGAYNQQGLTIIKALETETDDRPTTVSANDWFDVRNTLDSLVYTDDESLKSRTLSFSVARGIDQLFAERTEVEALKIKIMGSFPWETRGYSTAVKDTLGSQQSAVTEFVNPIYLDLMLAMAGRRILRSHTSHEEL